VRKIAARRGKYHGIERDFAHAVCISDRLLPEAALDLRENATPVGR
jgi:hypothetical protein